MGWRNVGYRDAVVLAGLSYLLSTTMSHASSYNIYKIGMYSYIVCTLIAGSFRK